MIKFRCASCGQKLGVQSELAGKYVRCKHCDAVNRVPGAEFSEGSSSEATGSASAGSGAHARPIAAELPEMPFDTDFRPPSRLDALLYLHRKDIRWALILAAVSVTLLCMYWFVWRDPWIAEHGEQIIALQQRGATHLQAQQYDKALSEYHHLFTLVGQRDVTDRQIRAAIDEARRGEKTARTWKNYLSGKSQFEERFARADATFRSGQYDQAMEEFERLADDLAAYESLVKPSRDLADEVRRQITAILHAREKNPAQGASELAQPDTTLPSANPLSSIPASLSTGGQQ